MIFHNFLVSKRARGRPKGSKNKTKRQEELAAVLMTDDTLPPAPLLDGEVNSSSMNDQLVERRRPGRPTKEAVRMPVRVEIVVCVFHLFIFLFLL